MRYTIFLFFFMLTVVFADRSLAQDEIVPFGDLTWEDSFTSATLKLMSLPGLEKCEASCLMRKIDLLKVKDPNRLQNIPRSVMEGSMLLLKNEVFVERKTGKKRQYANGPHKISVNVYPVMIAGVPFTLGADFVLNPGLLLVKPSNAIVEKDGTLIPIVLSSVGLLSQSDALRLKRSAISSVISQKYFGGKTIGGATQRKDASGTIFSVVSGSSLYKIDYGALYGSGYCQMLTRTFASYNAEQAVKAGEGKPDMSNKL